MHIHRTAPKSWIVTGVACGVFFMFGALGATVLSTPRIVIAGGALVLVVLGIYAAITSRRNTVLRSEHEAVSTALQHMKEEDASLRTHMAYSLRDPLTAIVGLADHMAHSPELSFAAQHELLIAMRSDALKVERALSDLADLDASATNASAIEAVVLLDHEVESTAATTMTDTIFELNVAPTRAWGDSAKVRSILRTMLHAVTTSGCTHMTLHASEHLGRAIVSISGRGDLLSPPEIAALTGNTIAGDKDDLSYRALRNAYEIAASMGGVIAFRQTFGVSQVVLDLPLVPDDLGISTSRTNPSQPFSLGTSPEADLRSEGPTSTIGFS